MKLRIVSFVLLFSLVGFSFGQKQSEAAPGKAKRGVQVIDEKNKVRVEVGGKLFTEYHYQDVPRPFCYPVIGPNDLPMTRNWPMKEVAGEDQDHPHHRGLWFTHGNVNGFDFWSEQKIFGKILHHKLHTVQSGHDYGLIVTENNWVSPHGKVICRDTRVLKVHAKENPKILDFEITIKADEQEVVFGDTKEGSMAIRLAETMRLKPNEFNKDKPIGHIVQATGVRDAETWGKQAAWCDYSGPVDGKTMGVAILDHPNNPRHPTWWHVRDYGLFAANPFGVHDFEKKEKGAGDLKIPAGGTVTFRYRFVFHEGDEKQAGIADLYSRYCAEKTTRVEASDKGRKTRSRSLPDAGGRRGGFN
jgi:hypothetical protein